MNSSIRRLAQVRSDLVTPRIWPCSSNSITGSGRSKSMLPRSSRRLFISTASVRMRSKSATSVGVARARLGVAFENRVDLGVGHARRRADDAFDDLVALDAAFGVELHDAAQHQPVFAGAQAADVRRELLRQHGNGAIGEVDAGSAQARFEVEIGAGAHVLGHVGDVHLQLVAAAVGAFGHQDCIVEVARGLAVDGDDGQSAKIPAALRLQLRSRCATLRASASTLSGKTRGNWCLRIIISTSTPKSSGSPSTSITRPMGGRVGVGQLVISTSTTRPSRSSWCGGCRGFGAQDAMRRGGCRLRRQLLPRRNEDGLRHALVEGNDRVTRVTVRASVVKDADNGRIAALEHADDAAQAAAIGARRLHFDQHLVALHGAVDLVGRDEDIVFLARIAWRAIGPHKAVAVAMQIEPAGGQIVARRRRDAAECSSARGRA